MNGQMSILDYLDQDMNIHIPDTDNVPPILLKKGEVVYKVVRGDVESLQVYDEKPWICGGGKERGYRLKSGLGGYDCCWNKSLGVSVFKSYNEALRVAEEYLNNNDCIRSSDIVPIVTVAYKYIRSIDSKEMISFYSELENGLLYIKSFFEYEHICEFDEDLIMEFYNEALEKKAEAIEYNPTYKNMYKCKDNSDKWKYCEARCTK